MEAVSRREAVEGRSGAVEVADRIREFSIVRICWKVASEMWESNGRFLSRIMEGVLGADSGSKIVVTIERSLRVRLTWVIDGGGIVEVDMMRVDCSWRRVRNSIPSGVKGRLLLTWLWLTSVARLVIEKTVES